MILCKDVIKKGELFMEFISNFINNFINVVSSVLYQPWCVPLILLVGGITLTIRSKFIQVRLFTECFKVITEKPTTEGGISSFGALMVSTASRVGTGNIIGVATAICAGGAGAVFWMWITAIIGGASAFVESTLAQIYKKRNDDGTSYGGPAFYMRDALKKRWLGVLFSFLIILTYAVGYNMLAAYNLQDTFSVFGFYVKGTTPVIIGAILAVLFGIKRGLYSNEAGMGSAPNAAATADVSHPAKQGLVQMLSVFIDTLLICTATAFMCLSSGVSFNTEMGGAAYVQTSMAENLGAFGPIFLSIAMSLFAFTTLIGNYSYCEGCLRFILNRDISKGGILAFRILATLLVFVGAVANAGTVWNLADMTQGLMVIVNVPVILILAKPALLCLEDYCRQKKEGRNPVFVAKDAGIDADLDFWKK